MSEKYAELIVCIGFFILLCTFAIGVAFGMFIMKQSNKHNQIEVIKNN